MANPPDNVARVKRALSVLADNAAADVADTDVREYVVVRIADEVIVDLMGRACGLSYADVISDAETRELGGATIRVASPSTLIRTEIPPTGSVEVCPWAAAHPDRVDREALAPNAGRDGHANPSTTNRLRNGGGRIQNHRQCKCFIYNEL